MSLFNLGWNLKHWTLLGILNVTFFGDLLKGDADLWILHDLGVKTLISAVIFHRLTYILS